MKTIENLKSVDFVGAICNMGADAFLIEDEDIAQEVFESFAETSASVLTAEDGEEFEEEMSRLDLSAQNEVKRIIRWNNGVVCSLCLSNDWN